MKKVLSAVTLALGMLGSQSASALPYNEVGDAGYSLATAQLLPGSTTSISGSLDAVDIYRFSWGGGVFSATANTGFDPMLYVFDLAGNRLAFNDDFFGLQSFVSLSLTSGDYLLAIDHFSFNYGGNLGGFANAGSNLGGDRYTINLGQATVSSNVPEPASLALAGLGLAGIGFSRRKKK